jgi:HAD superfamily hydrolase (TIGR01509 family)
VKAILFDLDGVLVDAVALHREAFLSALLIGEVMMTAEEHDRSLNGLPTRIKLRELVREGRISEELAPIIADHKQRMTRALIEKYVHHDQQKYDLIRGLKADGYFVGCVSNAVWSSVTRMLHRAGLLGLMDIVLSNEDLENPKPAPDGWHIAMKRLGVYPSQTLIIEDSEPGLISARASGAHVLAVRDPTEVTRERIDAALAEEEAA